jgi:thioredoxin reductase
VTLFHARGSSGVPRDACKRLARLGVTVVREPVLRLEGPATDLAHVVVAGDRRVRCEALFIKAGCAAPTDLAARMGCRMNETGEVQVGDHGQTYVPGVWAAGDVSSRLKLAIVAAAEGALAATDIQRSLREEEQALRLAEAPAA